MLTNTEDESSVILKLVALSSEDGGDVSAHIVH